VSAFFTDLSFQRSSTIMWRANFMCGQSQMPCVLLFTIMLVVWSTRQRVSWIRTAISFHLKWFSCSGSHIGTSSGFSSSVHSPKQATCTHLAKNHHVVPLKVLRYDKPILRIRALIEELLVTHLVNKHPFLYFLSDSLLLCLHKATTQPSCGPGESSALLFVEHLFY
jgi:hypothetical protein